QIVEGAEDHGMPVTRDNGADVDDRKRIGVVGHVNVFLLYKQTTCERITVERTNKRNLKLDVELTAQAAANEPPYVPGFELFLIGDAQDPRLVAVVVQAVEQPCRHQDTLARAAYKTAFTDQEGAFAFHHVKEFVLAGVRVGGHACPRRHHHQVGAQFIHRVEGDGLDGLGVRVFIAVDVELTCVNHGR